MLPTQQRYIAIGDIHGCNAQLQTLLERLPLRSDDYVVFLGDYIDRGPDVPGTIETLLAFQQQHPHCVFLRGNHDAMFLDFAGITHDGTADSYLDPCNGGATTLRQYGCSEELLYRCRMPDHDDAWRAAVAHVPQKHVEFLARTRYCFATPQYLFVHAGINPARAGEMQRVLDLLWIREEFLQHPHRDPRLIVYGHTPVLAPPFAPRDEPDQRRLGIDTGAVYGGRLTAVVLPTREVISVAGVPIAQPVPRRSYNSLASAPHRGQA